MGNVQHFEEKRVISLTADFMEDDFITDVDKLLEEWFDAEDLYDPDLSKTMDFCEFFDCFDITTYCTISNYDSNEIYDDLMFKISNYAEDIAWKEYIKVRAEKIRD